MPHRGFEPRHRPRSNEVAPKLATLLSSNLKNSQNLQVYSYKLKPRPEFSTSAEGRSRTDLERVKRLRPLSSVARSADKSVWHLNPTSEDTARSCTGLSAATVKGA